MDEEADFSRARQEDKMCSRCFSLFKQATDIILASHCTEQALIAQSLGDIEHGLTLLLDLIKPRSKIHNTLVQEMITALKTTVLYKQPYQGLKNTIRKLECTRDLSISSGNEGHLTDCHSPIVQNSLREEPEMSPEKSEVELVQPLPQPEAAKYSIFSCQSSRDDKNLTLNIKNLYETASFNKIYSSNSERNIKVTNPEMSEIDKRIKELEDEKNRAEEETFVAQLPAHYSVFSKKKSVPIEGKSIEMNTTVETAFNQMSVNQTLELIADKQDDNFSVEHTKSEVSMIKPSKKQDLMSLVYKVNNKMLDLDKFDRKKSKNCFKENRENKEEAKILYKGEAKPVKVDQEVRTPASKTFQQQNTGVNFNKRRLTPTPIKNDSRNRAADQLSKTPDVQQRAIGSHLLKLSLPKPN